MAEKGLISMKRPKRDREDMAMPQPMADEYGYGLQIRLENFELDKLGMKLPKAGQQVRISAVGKVVSVHQSTRSGEEETESDRGVQIQITDLAVSQGASE